MKKNFLHDIFLAKKNFFHKLLFIKDISKQKKNTFFWPPVTTIIVFTQNWRQFISEKNEKFEMEQVHFIPLQFVFASHLCDWDSYATLFIVHLCVCK